MHSRSFVVATAAVGGLFLIVWAGLVLSWIDPGLWLNDAGLQAELAVLIGLIAAPTAVMA